MKTKYDKIGLGVCRDQRLSEAARRMAILGAENPRVSIKDMGLLTRVFTSYQQAFFCFCIKQMNLLPGDFKL